MISTPTLQTSIAPGGSAAIPNAGSFEMRPVLVVMGPCTNPMVTNLSLNGSPAMTFTGTLNAGDTLTIDMGARTADYVASGSSTLVSWWGKRIAGSTPFNLPPGVNSIGFSAATHSGACACLITNCMARRSPPSNGPVTLPLTERGAMKVRNSGLVVMEGCVPVVKRLDLRAGRFTEFGREWIRDPRRQWCRHRTGSESP